jgi:hypothetical protein
MQTNSWKSSEAYRLTSLPNSKRVLDSDLIRALSFVNRWGGWLQRPFSVLEHSVIGTVAMIEGRCEPLDCLGFLLHDVEEAVFGDRITPLKERHSAIQYWIDVEDFNRRLCTEVGISHRLLSSNEVKLTDYQCAAAESRSVAVRGDVALSCATLGQRGKAAERMIRHGDYGNSMTQRTAFWELYYDLTNLCGLSATHAAK